MKIIYVILFLIIISIIVYYFFSAKNEHFAVPTQTVTQDNNAVADIIKKAADAALANLASTANNASINAQNVQSSNVQSSNVSGPVLPNTSNIVDSSVDLKKTTEPLISNGVLTTNNLSIQKNVNFVDGNESWLSLPKGSIMLWSGSYDTIPTGWIACEPNVNTTGLVSKINCDANCQSQYNILNMNFNDKGTFDYGVKWSPPDLRGRMVLGYDPRKEGLNNGSTYGGLSTTIYKHGAYGGVTSYDYNLLPSDIPIHTHGIAYNIKPVSITSANITANTANAILTCESQGALSSYVNMSEVPNFSAPTKSESIKLGPKPYMSLYYIYKYM